MGAVAQLGERLNGIQEVKGSIPFSSMQQSWLRPRAEIGRQAGLRDQCQKWRTGSSPAVGMLVS
jgi:hypothetical protein